MMVCMYVHNRISTFLVKLEDRKNISKCQKYQRNCSSILVRRKYLEVVAV